MSSKHSALLRSKILLFTAIALCLIAVAIANLLLIDNDLFKKDGATNLTYYIEGVSAPFSLDPLDVDRLTNSIIVEELVGTLVRTDRSHRRSPYLAESWFVSSGNKQWTFVLRNGLRCEDGSAITAEHFVETFNWLLKLHLGKNKNVPVFQDLEGWTEFKANRTDRILGLSVEPGERIRFSFVRPADIGFLAYLSIPQFGFYCRTNFNRDGRWKQTDRFVSSGPYSLLSIASDRLSAALQARADWPLHGEGSPTNVKVQQTSDLLPLEKIQDPNVFFIRSTNSDSPLPDRYTSVEGAMTGLSSLVVTPFMDNLFSDQHNRAVFLKRFRDWQRTSPLTYTRVHPSNYFYSDQREMTDPVVYPSEYRIPAGSKKILKLIHTSGFPKQALAHYIEGIRVALAGTGIDIEPIVLNKNDPHAFKTFLSNKDYDLRIVSVVAGGGFVNWMTEMMFCSDLGVCFPDPSSRICSLVKEQNVQPISEKEYASRFNQILTEDASVIPLHHSGSVWVFGEGVSPDYISPVSPSPLFDQLRLK